MTVIDHNPRCEVCGLRAICNKRMALLAWWAEDSSRWTCPDCVRERREAQAAALRARYEQLEMWE